MIPTFILQTWLFGLLALGIVTGGVYLGHEWYHRSWGWDAALQQSVWTPALQTNDDRWLLAIAVFLLLWAVAGGSISKAVLKIFCQKRQDGEIDPRVPLTPQSRQEIKRPDGSVLNVEFYGPADAPPILLTHGWTLHSGEWNYLKRELSDKFRLIVWDEPGLGKSSRPNNGDYRLENLAADLGAVLDLAGNRPVILLGHSIGGMITLTFCRLFPEIMRSRIAGLVLTHTTPTNPVRTTSGAAFFSAIEKPVLVPLMYLTIYLSPLVWLMNWLSFFNGSAHHSARKSSFAGTETWEELDFVARFTPHSSPAVQARGMLGMMHYDALSVLPQISVPVLIVAGDQDTTTKPEASQLMEAQIPKARLTILSPAKHLGLIEHHEQYAKLVREFAHQANSEMESRTLLAAGLTKL